MRRAYAIHTSVWTLAVLSVLVLPSSPALGLNFPWVPATDGNAVFSYVNGRNEGAADLYKTPTLMGYGFLFENTANFRSDGGGGAGQSTSNVAFAELTAVSNSLENITVREWGTYSVGAGQTAASVLTLQADMTLQVFLPGPPFISVTQFDIDNAFLDFKPDGTWESRGTLTPALGAWNNAWLSVSNTLVVESTAAPGSFFTKAGMEVIVPEPTSLVLLIVGITPVLRRRRRA